MNATLVDEWIEKAETDYETAVMANRKRKRPIPDSVCFHCQQCAEKYLKAFLIQQGTSPAYTHDLQPLLRDCVAFDVALQTLLPLMQNLTPYSVRYRYPGLTATATEAQSALTDLRVVRKVLRKKLGK